MKSVYSAVRTELLNEAVWLRLLKVNDEKIKSFPDINPFLVLF
jgi:hypothetical protein